MQPDQLSREVNRLYWETDAPVTRLAEQLGVSRGTFYNHLEPMPAPGKCTACGDRLFFGSRANRDNGDAQCGACGHEQRVAAGKPASARSAAARARATETSRPMRVDRDDATPAAATHTRESALLASRVSWLGSPEDEDRLRTQLIFVAVGAAVLGLGILYFSRRR